MDNNGVEKGSASRRDYPQQALAPPPYNLPMGFMSILSPLLTLFPWYHPKKCQYYYK